MHTFGGCIGQWIGGCIGQWIGGAIYRMSRFIWGGGDLLRNNNYKSTNRKYLQ